MEQPDHFEGQLGSQEIVSRLFATANKNGVYADKAIYGQGLMDLNAATEPVGQVSAMMSLSLSGPMTPAIFSNIQLTSIRILIPTTLPSEVITSDRASV